MFAALALSLVAVLLGSAPVSAFPAPGTGANNQPAQFLPAPNETAYCDAPDYFGPIDQSVDLVAANGSLDVDLTFDQNGDGDPTNDVNAQQVSSVTADTGPSNLSLVATTVDVGATPGNSVLSPQLHVPTSEIGLVMGRDAVVNVQLSEPMFYTQWIFTDVDQAREGFEVAPSWIGSGHQAAAFGGNASFAFAPTDANFEASGPGSSSILLDFNDTDSSATDGHLVAGRVQADFLGPVDGLTLTKTGAGGSGFTVGGGCAAIGASKTSSAPVWNAATGQFDVTYTINVVNNLPSSATLDTIVNNALSSAGSSFISGTPEGIDGIELQVVDALDLSLIHI